MQSRTIKERDKGRLMNPRDIKRRANAIRRAMTGEPLYDRKYKDLRVADLLIVLEDDIENVAEQRGLTLSKVDIETIKHRYYKLDDETWEQIARLMDELNLKKGE